MKLSLFHWYPGSGVVLDCINSRSLPSFLLLCVCVFMSVSTQRLNHQLFWFKTFQYGATVKSYPTAGGARDRAWDPWVQGK